MKGFPSKCSALEADVSYVGPQKYTLHRHKCACSFQPSNFTGWGSGGVNKCFLLFHAGTFSSVIQSDSVWATFQPHSSHVEQNSQVGDTESDSIPWCSKDFLLFFTVNLQTLLWCFYSPKFLAYNFLPLEGDTQSVVQPMCATACMNVCAHIKKSQNPKLWTHEIRNAAYAYW